MFVRVIAPSGNNATMRAVFTCRDQYVLPTGALAAFGAPITDFEIPPTGEEIWGNGLSAYLFTPPPAAGPLVLDFVVYVDATRGILAAGSLVLPQAGGAYTLAELAVADLYVDTTGNPWARVAVAVGEGLPAFLGGTAPEILRQRLFDSAGQPIATETKPIGRTVK